MNAPKTISRKMVAVYIALTYFFILISYSLLGSATKTFFLEHYTTNDYSLATFFGITFLMGLIALSNYLQTKVGVQKIYLSFCLGTIILLTLSYLGLGNIAKQFAYAIFAVKEAHIVLLVHLSLAYANAYFSLDELKKYIGPMGAMGSVGGIIGGQITSYAAKGIGTEFVFFLSFIFLVISGIVFFQTHSIVIKGLNINKSISPLQAVRGVKRYVILIGAVVALSQIVIYLADLQFNFVFEQNIIGKDARTAFSGDFESIKNLISLLIQFIVLPLLLTRVNLKNIFIFIPALYLLLVTIGAGYGVGMLFVMTGIYGTMKGMDYSLFAATKDIMYHPLLSLQKFGAKYIIDMFVYRSSKAIIALIMAQFVVKDIIGGIITMQIIFLALWIVAVILLFEEQKKLNK